MTVLYREQPGWFRAAGLLVRAALPDPCLLILLLATAPLWLLLVWWLLTDPDRPDEGDDS